MDVTMIVALAAISGVFGLLAAFVILVGGGVVGAASGLGEFLFVAGIIILVYSILSLALVYGLWTLKPWAWPLGVGVQALGVIQAVLQFLNDGDQIVSLLVSLAIAGLIVWYLFRPQVRTAFGRA